MTAGRRIALVAAALVLSGCGAGGSTAIGVGGATPAAPLVLAVPRDGHVCLDLPGDGEQPSGSAAEQVRSALGPGQPTAFVECDTTVERVPGRGEWSVRRERRADAAGSVALAAALRLPDLPSDGPSCSAVGHVLPELYAVDDSRHAALVSWPVDGCGAPRPEVVAAYQAVRWAPVASRRLRQATPQAALDSGCSDAWKDIVVLEGVHAGARHGRGTLDAVAKATTVRSCTYRVTERGQAPGGSFEAGRNLDAAAWQRVLNLLEAAPAGPDGCTTVGNRFAVLSDGRAAGSGELYVELDGCKRVLTPDDGLRAATPELIKSLTGP